VLAALKSEALPNESVGAGCIDRNWPPALQAEGAWPLASLRQIFLNGSLTRLVDRDPVLKSKIVEFAARGDFGLASGKRADGTFERVWFQESAAGDEVAFEAGVFLLRKSTAEAFRAGATPSPAPTPTHVPSVPSPSEPGPAPAPAPRARTLRLYGTVPPEIWNRLGTKILPKLKAGTDLRIGVDLSVTISADAGAILKGELQQILQELGLGESVLLE
jgi:hypothetical protein